jgi:iron complex transport system ATP-binding protein
LVAGAYAEELVVIVEGRDLTIGYRDRTVGSGLSVALATGEVLALLGPNGGGKTTLLKTLLGLISPKAGEVRLGERTLDDYSIRERARAIAYVPQVHVGTFAFTVETVVLMGRSAHGNLFSRPRAHDREVAAAALERFGIGRLSQRPYTEISGGERQLVLLARALAQEPQFIVLDEPTASLDFGNQGKVMREIRALAKSGHGVLFTTHDPNHALRAADRAFLLRDGICLAEGPVARVLDRAQLEQLYQAPVEQLADPDTGSAAFLPGW